MESSLPLSNSYSYQSYQRQRQLTLGDLLLENRIVFLQGEIYTGNANEVVMKLLYLQSENRRKDIHFYLNYSYQLASKARLSLGPIALIFLEEAQN